MAEYRIVRDRYCGYEVQVRRWWFPIWVMAGFCNTFSSVEQAEEYARQRAGEVVKQLGRLS
jgi:hypothetical protein